MKVLVNTINRAFDKANLPIGFFYGRAPAEGKKPYATFTLSASNREPSFGEYGDIATLTINVWSAEEDLAEILDIAEMVMAKIEAIVLDFDDDNYGFVRIDRTDWSLVPADELGTELGWTTILTYTIYYTHKTE